MSCKRNPQEAGSELSHDPAGNEDRQLVGTLEVPRAREEIGDRDLQQARQPLHFDFLVPRFRLIQRGFVVVVQQGLVVGARAGGHGCGQQALGQNHVGAQARAVGGMAALANALEADARGDHPGIGRGTLEVSRKYSKTVGCCGGAAMKLLMVS